MNAMPLVVRGVLVCIRVSCSAAGAQPGVLTLVLPECRPETPAMLHYETLLGSLYNTPPCWSIYICGLVFEHLLSQVC